MARRARVAAWAFALGWPALATAASAQTYATLHVPRFTMSADRVTTAVGETFHLTIVAHVDERVSHLDNLTLPDLSGFESLGDERRCFAVAPSGTDCVETVTLAATIGGDRTIPGATLDAIDARTGRPSRFTTNPVQIDVTAPVAADDRMAPALAESLFAFVRALVIFGLVMLAVLALVWGFSRRKPAPPAPAPAPPAPPPPAPDPRVRLRGLAEALVREPTRANALRLRSAMREALGAHERETLEDLVGRSAGAPEDRAALRAVERASFCEGERVADAVREAEPFLIR